jgi:hypothetical protein
MVKVVVKNAKMKLTPMIGFSLTTPAVIALVAYMMLALVIVLPFEFPITDQSTGEEYIVKYDLAQRIIVLLLMSIPIALSVYTINCMMAGQCMLWSYVISLLTVFWIVLFIITAVMYTLRRK